MIFNPITNQPMDDYKSKKEQLQKEKEKEFEEKYKKQEINYRTENTVYNNNEKEKIPIEYNPYKHPYSVYQGHP